jgi:polyhydroxybutyrate depolymerase
MKAILFVSTFSLPFLIHAQCAFTEVTIETSTGQWSEEMSWDLYHVLENGEELIATFQGETNQTTTSQELCLEDGCYYLQALDSWGDGWNGGEVSCTPILEGFEQSFELEEGYEGYLAFQVGDGVCSTSLPGCTDPNALNPVQGANTDDGSCVYIETFSYSEIGSAEVLEREYIYYHPESASAGCPLVFVFHGYTGNAQDIMEYSEFNALAEEFGFAVCYPQGSTDGSGSTFFNVGYDFQQNEDVDDLGFVLALNDHLQDNQSLDPAAVYATGMSNGGDFCYLLACQASEVFQAVAPVAGMIMQDIMDACNPTTTTSILEIHGTDDDVTYYEGDPYNVDGWGAYPSIPQTMDFFLDLFQLSGAATFTALDDLDPTDGSEVTVSSWSNDEGCPRVELYDVVGGGHDWPGAWGNMDIDASRVAWEFFESTCNNEPSNIEFGAAPMQPSPAGTWDLLGRPADVNESGQILIQRWTNGQVKKSFQIRE